MPVEIKELIIRAEVDQSQGPSQGHSPRPDRAIDKEAIVRAAVEEVMRVLKEKESR